VASGPCHQANEEKQMTVIDSGRAARRRPIPAAQRGQAKIEYAALIVLVGAFVVSVLIGLGEGVGAVYSDIRWAVAGELDRLVAGLGDESVMALTINTPPIQVGTTHSWSEPALADWLHNRGAPGIDPGSFAHPFRGSLANAPEGAVIHLSIHTNAWWDQPDATIDADGGWQTTAYLHAGYRHAATFRVEVVVDGETIATYDTRIRPSGRPSNG
jgi:Flp pilus assembly pilin Flp